MDSLLQHVGRPTAGMLLRRKKYNIEIFIEISRHSGAFCLIHRPQAHPGVTFWAPYKHGTSTGMLWMVT